MTIGGDSLVENGGARDVGNITGATTATAGALTSTGVINTNAGSSPSPGTNNVAASCTSTNVTATHANFTLTNIPTTSTTAITFSDDVELEGDNDNDSASGVPQQMEKGTIEWNEEEKALFAQALQSPNHKKGKVLNNVIMSFITIMYFLKY